MDTKPSPLRRVGSSVIRSKNAAIAQRSRQKTWDGALHKYLDVSKWMDSVYQGRMALIDRFVKSYQ